LAIVTSVPVDVSCKLIMDGLPLDWLAVKFGVRAIVLKFYPNIRNFTQSTD
jgi:hypothetical protein